MMSMNKFLNSCAIAFMVGSGVFAQHCGHPELHDWHDYAVLMCVVERNTIRMELYTPQELISDSVVCLSKNERDKHCFLHIDMSEQGLNVFDARWSTERPGCMCIKTGRKLAPVIYDLNILQAFDVNSEHEINVLGCCVDCEFEPVCKDSRTDNADTWLTCVRMQIPVDTGLQECMMLFDRKLKNLCCMILPADIFECPLRCCGRLKKYEALDQGLLCCIDDMCDKEDQDELSAQSCMKHQDNVDAVPLVSAEEPAIQTSEQSWLSYATDKVNALISSVAQGVSSSYNAVLAYVVGK